MTIAEIVELLKQRRPHRALVEVKRSLHYAVKLLDQTLLVALKLDAENIIRQDESRWEKAKEENTEWYQTIMAGSEV